MSDAPFSNLSSGQDARGDEHRSPHAIGDWDQHGPRDYVKPLNAMVNTAWRNALKKSGIEDFRFHDTRHTWASLLIQNGVAKGMIKEMGGWKSDSMVERYAHLAPEHLARHAAVLDEILPAPREQNVESDRGVGGKGRAP